MATGVKKKPTKGGLYQAWYTDCTGKRKYFTAPTRTQAKQEAKRLDSEHRLVRQGIRPAPSSAEKHKKRPFEEVKQEYFNWGETQGGRGGRAWGMDHARNRRTRLNWWQDQLGLGSLGDLVGILPRAEKASRELLKTSAGKTVANYVEALRSFCVWCRKRGYLDQQPLEGMAPFDTTPQSYRRVLTPEEIIQFLDACAPHRRLLYEAAFLTGLRASELRRLTLEHLDVEHSGLQLEAEWTKNRKPCFQPLPKDLANKLYEFARSEEPSRLYAKFHKRKHHTATMPKQPLLYVPSHTARSVDQDLLSAGIPKHGPGGKIDFHAIRKAYINLVIESGVTVKEAQTLARHASPELTMNVYGHAREDRLADAVERVAEVVLPVRRVPVEYQQAVGAETENATSDKTEGCVSYKWWRRRESNP
jgi:integrase